ncbi:MAG: C10 family peptidase [Muribaculaceae bacterium]|nr:C10 family peptidase [Muribaculaceae bacterium]
MKRILLAGVIVALWTGGYARQLSPEEAVGRVAAKAAGSVAAGQSRRAAAYRGVGPKMTLRDRQGNNCVYLFSDGSGFMLLSADDCGAPVLGYGDTPLTDTVQMPPAMRAWLSGYTRQIEEGIMAGIPVYSDSEASQLADVAPLIQSKWNQGAPFNDQCPMYDEESRCVTGCVATATAQLMYYHKFPAQGKGSHSYTAYIKGRTEELSADFGSTTYDWALMQPVYDDKNSTESNAEVAKLMAHLGVATEMMYGYQNSNQSGTPQLRACEAMLKYFGYSPAMTYELKSSYSEDEWRSKLHAELAEGRPVLYEGESIQGGHSFVCDGYAADSDMFHFNWGWGGAADGYFILSALNPNTSGQAGGAGYDFNEGQSGLFGLRPAREGDKTEPIVVTYGDLYAEYPNVEYNDYAIISTRSFEYDGFFNHTVSEGPTLRYWNGMELESKADGTKYYVSENMVSDVPSNNGSWNIQVNVWDNDVPEGDYTARPVVRLDSDENLPENWKPIKVQYGCADAFDVHVGKFYATFANSLTTKVVLTANNVKYPEKLQLGEPFTVTADVTARHAESQVEPYVYAVAPNGEYFRLGTGHKFGIGKEQTVSISIDCCLQEPLSDGCILVLTDSKEIFYEGGEFEMSPSELTISELETEGDAVTGEDFILSFNVESPYIEQEAYVTCRLVDEQGKTVSQSPDGYVVIIGPGYGKKVQYRIPAIDQEGQYRLIVKFDAREVETDLYVTVKDRRIDVSDISYMEVNKDMEYREVNAYLTLGYGNSYDGIINLRYEREDTGEPYCYLSAQKAVKLDKGIPTFVSLEHSSDLPDGKYRMYMYVTEDALAESGVDIAGPLPLQIDREGSVEGVEQSGGLRVDVSGDRVAIYGLTPGRTAAIYSISGAKIAEWTALEESMAMDAATFPAGLYLLKSGNKVIKFILK